MSGEGIICKLKKKNTDMIADEECDRVFKLVDLNKDDQISLSEFMLGAQKDAWLMDLLKLDVMAHSWFRHNWKKKK
ncbi:guanylate cyclase activator 1g [Tachysurus ichikawai]